MAPRPRLVSSLPVPVPQQAPMQQDGWVWDGANWTCDGNPSPPPCPPPCAPAPCPPPGWPQPCPPFYPPPSNQAPWYPGANGGVSFSQTAPSCPTRGNFWWDGKILWLFDGAAWVDVGVAGISTLLGTSGVYIGSGTPVSPSPGMLWWNGTILQLWDGVKWNLIGPQAQTTPTAGIMRIDFFMSTQIISIPTGATKAFIQMWGGTGGSGGVNGTDSAGTGGAGYLEKLLTGLVAGNTLNFTCGQAGQGGAPQANGTNGTASVLTSGTQSISALTANGSNGTIAGQNTSGGPSVPESGSPGGTAMGGDVNITGQAGGDVNPGTGYSIPAAGTNLFSFGAHGVVNSGSQSGMDGTPGGLKVTWYYS